MRQVLAAFLIFSVLTNSSRAGQLPDGFIGIWMITNGSGEVCKKSEWKDEEVYRKKRRRMFRVTEKSIEGDELDCRFSSIKNLGRFNAPEETFDDTMLVETKCSGPTSQWKQTGTWFLSELAGQVVLSRIDTKEDTIDSEMGKSEDDDVESSIAIKCGLDQLPEEFLGRWDAQGNSDACKKKGRGWIIQPQQIIRGNEVCKVSSVVDTPSGRGNIMFTVQCQPSQELVHEFFGLDEGILSTGQIGYTGLHEMNKCVD